MIGREIKQKLLQEGYAVRILTRNKLFRDDRVQVYYGNLENIDILKVFLKNVNYLFHCAAELHNESKMWDVNVSGTEIILNLIPQTNITYFCYLSSAGVVGRTSIKYVKENTPCNPRNIYERSKWAAEQIVQQGIPNCQVVILRPTNVITDEEPGALNLPMRSSCLDYLKVFLQGGECAHIVHAMDVADAAIHLISHSAGGPECFFVSYDDEPLNMYADIWSLYKAHEKNHSFKVVRPALHLPAIIPYLLRVLWRGGGNKGNVRYSSKKLLSSGFDFPMGLHGTIKRIASLKIEENL